MNATAQLTSDRNDEESAMMREEAASSTIDPRIEALYDKRRTIMYRCPRCKAAARIEAKVQRHMSLGRAPFFTPQLLSQDFLILGEEYRHYQPHQVPSIPCTCGASMVGKVLHGTTNAEVPCDRRCTGAKGHNCECSCGGRNHGIDHAR